MKRGLHIALADARRRGAAEGSAEAAEVARKPLVRRTAIAVAVPQVTPAQWDAWRVARMACAIEERDVYGFGEETDDVHGS